MILQNFLKHRCFNSFCCIWLQLRCRSTQCRSYVLELVAFLRCRFIGFWYPTHRYEWSSIEYFFRSDLLRLVLLDLSTLFSEVWSYLQHRHWPKSSAPARHVVVSSADLSSTAIFRFLSDTLSLFSGSDPTVVCRIVWDPERWRPEVRHCFIFCRSVHFCYLA